MAAPIGTPVAEPAGLRAAHPTEILISNILRAGVVCSIVLVVVGTVLTFVHHPGYLTSSTELASLKASRAFPTSLPGVVRGLEHGQGRAVVMVGLLVLLATPIVRVAVSIVAFWHQRDRTFVAITSAVLALLMVSLVLGKAGG